MRVGAFGLEDEVQSSRKGSNSGMYRVQGLGLRV